MNDLSPEARRLLSDARDADDPTSSDLDRVRRALATSLGAAAFGAATAQAGALTATATASVGAVKVLVLAAIVGTGAAVAWRARPSHPVVAHAPAVHVRVVQAPPSPAPIAASVASSAAPPVPTPAPVAPSVDVVATAPGHADAPRPRTAEPSVDALAAVSAMLGAAHRATTAGDAAHALALLHDYAVTFPRGALREEGDVERVRALCALDRVDEAGRAARAFVRAHPRSPLASRVAAGCATTGVAAAPAAAAREGGGHD